MRPRLNQTLSLVLATVLTSQAALASTAESNFWAERRRAASTITNQPNLRSQMASLPHAGALGRAALLNQLPSVRTTLAPELKWSPSEQKKYAKFSPRFRRLIESIPMNFGTIQEEYESDDDEKSPPPVVLVQDVHLNTEAQGNIASVLQELIDQRQIAVVGVEGAFGKFDFAPFRVFPDKNLTKQVAQAFVDKNLMAAPSQASPSRRFSGAWMTGRTTMPMSKPICRRARSNPRWRRSCLVYKESCRNPNKKFTRRD